MVTATVGQSLKLNAVVFHSFIARDFVNEISFTDLFHDVVVETTL